MIFPDLKISNRNGEYSSYSIIIRAEVVYNYLFQSLSHRKIDKDVIGLIPEKSKGWQSMGILHHIGLVKAHKGIFSNVDLLDAISFLKKEDKIKYKVLIKHIEVFSNETIDSFELERELNNKVLKSSQDTQEIRLNRLKLLDDSCPKQVSSVTRVYIRNADVIVEVLKRANGICERCLKPAPFIRASDNTPYLEVHHIIPLSAGGLDNLNNTIALCPNCHRELHFGKINNDAK